MTEANSSTQKPQKNGRDLHDRVATIVIPLTFVAATTAAVFTGIAASHTGRQADIAADAEKRQLRAYVGIKPGDIENFGDQKDQTWTLIGKNYGQTPAYEMGFAVRIGDIIRAGRDTIPSYNPCSIEPKQSGFLSLSPGMDMTFYKTGTKSFSAAQLNFVRDNEGHMNENDMVFVYYGSLCYKDAFGRPHYTSFCWMYKGKSMTAKDAIACVGNNDAN